MSSAKRKPTSELNHDNWDDEVEAEEAGTFSMAKQEDLQKRVIKTAKRRKGGAAAGGSGGGIFSGFGGFGNLKPSSSSTPFSTKTTSIVKSAGDQQAQPYPALKTQNNGLSKDSSGPARPTKMAKVEQPSPISVSSTSTRVSEKSSTDFEKFSKCVRALNSNVIQWLKESVDQNPLVDLRPVFGDYQRHFVDLLNKFNQPGAANASSTFSAVSSESKPFVPPLLPVKTHADDEKKNMKPKDSGFSFGISPQQPAVNDASKPPSFAFGTQSAEKDEKKAESGQKTGFSFGLKAGDSQSPEKSSSGLFTFGKSDANEASDVYKPATDSGLFSFGTSSSSTVKDTSKPKDDAPQFPKLSGGVEVPQFPKVTPVPSGGGFSFGASKPAAPASGGFSFGLKDSAATGGLTGFKFGAVAATPASDSTDGAGDEEKPYEPPKVESVEHEEPDAFYSIKCKLFFNKDGKYNEKGVGTLFLKPLDNGKTQLLIRAATALGNVLLNISLRETMNFKRVGKNNVGFVCIPNPPIDPKDEGEQKPTALLVRVKSGEDADSLREKFESVAKQSGK